LPTCDIIVVGGSSGAIDGMQRIVQQFPADLNAAVFVVVHLSPEFHSRLPEILSRSGPLPARHPKDGEKIQRGNIYVAPPDRHLTIEDGNLRVLRGPRENRHRPAIDPLFRTASRVFDARVIGIILSGYQDDGSAGLRAVRARGGIAIIQDPEEATACQMPQSALDYGGADFVLPLEKIGAQVVALVDHCGRPEMKGKKPTSTNIENETEQNLTVSRPEEGVGVPSPFSCPECSGVLWELKNGELTRFRCRVGHAYTMAALAEDQTDGTEAALWAAMRALEEKAALGLRIADSTHSKRTGDRLREQAEADRAYAATIRKILFEDDAENDRKKSA
jgi:two-component system, chemotaxis family, protein-glutamate methylesterase/glutaminase